MRDMVGVRERLSAKEKELLDFTYDAEVGASYVYATSESGKTTSIMKLAHDCYECGLIHLVQKRAEHGFVYLAIKRKVRRL